MYFLKKNIYVLFFLLIILLYYYLNFYFFDGFVFYSDTDTLEFEILFNYILGKIYSGDFYIINSLLDGNYKWYYFTRIFFPVNFIYSLFSLEKAYLIIDFFSKIIAFYYFFKLTNHLQKNKFFSFIISATFAFLVNGGVAASSLLNSVFGFGLSIYPFFTYLILKKKNLSLKNYFYIFFFGLNTHFYFLLNSFFLFFFLFCIKKNKSVILKIMITYFISISLSNINLLYISLFENIPLTRDFRKTDIFLFKENLIFTLSNLSSYPIFFVKNAFEKNLYIPFFF